MHNKKHFSFKSQNSITFIQGNNNIRTFANTVIVPVKEAVI